MVHRKTDRYFILLHMLRDVNNSQSVKQPMKMVHFHIVSSSPTSSTLSFFKK